MSCSRFLLEIGPLGKFSIISNRSRCEKGVVALEMLYQIQKALWRGMKKDIAVSRHRGNAFHHTSKPLMSCLLTLERNAATWQR